MAFQLLYNYLVTGDLFFSFGIGYQTYPSRICHSSRRGLHKRWVPDKMGLSGFFQKSPAGPNALRGHHGTREQRMKVNLPRISHVLHHFSPGLEATCFVCVFFKYIFY